MISPEDARWTRRLLIAGALVLAGLTVWTLRDVLLLLFGSTLFALFLTSLAQPIARATPLPPGLAALCAALLVLAGLGGLIVFFGLRLENQVQEAAALLPAGLQVFQSWLRSSAVGRSLDAEISSVRLAAAAPALMRIPGYALTSMEAVGDALLCLVGGIYLALQPELYRRGLLALVPAAWKPRVQPLLNEAGTMLRRWLLAEVIAMISVGLLVGGGLALIGVPAWGALGLFAGLAEMIPLLGPVLSAVPALLLALLQGLGYAEATLILFVGVQQIEGNVLLPLLQRRIVRLPPVLTLFALVAFGLAFGFLGLFFAAPLTVVCMLGVQRLYLNLPPETATEALSSPAAVAEAPHRGEG